jgi:putative nucleotidyltransferase with HDIG domain
VSSGDGLAERVMGGQQAYVGPSMADGTPIDGQLVGVDELACIPLIAQAHSIGVLVVGRAHPFQGEDLRLLNAIGDMVANAIHRESLREQTERRLDRLSALRTIDEAITASVDLRLTLNILLEQVSAQLEVDGATVMLLSGHTQNLEFGAGWGVNSARLSPLQVRLGDGYTGRAALRREVVSVSDMEAAAERDPRAKILHREGFVACYAVPLIAKGKVKGVLEIFQRDRQQVDPEWEDFLGTLAGQAAIAIDNAMLFNDLQRSNTELTLAYDTTLEGWAHALELRDMETEGHSQRVTQMTLRLARAMGMRERELEHVRRGALLHDIGKMGIPDNILLKPGPLTDEEWEIMRRHPSYAYEMLAPISYLRPALEIPYCHHEKWDGTGYPRGLQGEEIPLAARIFAVIDVWDALRSDRPYRDAWEEDRVLDYIRSESGRHFDPDVVDRFMGLLD